MIRDNNPPKVPVNEWAWRTAPGAGHMNSYADVIELGYVISLFEWEGRWGIGTHMCVMWFEDEGAARMAWELGYNPEDP